MTGRLRAPDVLAQGREPSGQTAVLQVLLQSCDGLSIESADEALDAVPGDANPLAQATSDQLDIAGGGQEMIMDDRVSLAAARDEDETLARDREEPGLVIDVGDEELLDPFLVVELNSPTLEHLTPGHRLLSRGEQARKQRRDR